MTEIITQRFDIDDALWDPQLLDTSGTITGGSSQADIVRPLPQRGFRLLTVTQSTIRAFVDYNADRYTGDSQHGVYAPCEQVDDEDQFRVRFVFPTTSGNLGPYFGWFEAAFMRD